MTRRRERITFVAAILAHAAVIGIAWPFAAEVARPPEAPPAQGLIDITDLREPEAETPRIEPPAKSAEPEIAPPDALLRDTRGGGGRTTGPDLPPSKGPEAGPPSSATSPVPDVPAPAPTSEYGVAPVVPMAGTDPLGASGALGGPVWAVPGVLSKGPDSPGGARTPGATAPVGPRVSVAPGKGATLLRDDLRAHDAELGIGTTGGTTVANAIAEAVRGSTVPKEATAVLVARIGGDGTVISVSVQSFSAGDAKTWEGIAAAATGAIGKKKLGLAGMGKRGAIVRVSVRSTYTKPSGGGGGEPSKGVLRGVADAVAEGPDRTVAPAPSPDGDACAPERRSDLPPLCGVGLTVGHFDVTDLATRKHRYVRTSFSVKLLEDIVSALTPSAPTAAPPPVPSPARTAPIDAGAP